MDNQNLNQNGNAGNSYQADPFIQPSAYQQPVVIDELAHKKDMLATTSLIVGVLGMLFFWSFIVAIILCLIGLIMGIVSLAKTKRNSGLALAGVITSTVGICLSGIVFFLLILLA